MKVQTYSEEGLRRKKYSELSKIGKAIGVKSSKKLKTDKLIEAILECQDGNTISMDAEEVIAALADDQGKDLEKSGCVGPLKQKELESTEELLSDIQFPELCPLEEDETQKAVGNSSKNGCRRKNERSTGDDDVNEKQLKKRRRTGTFDIEKKNESSTEEAALSLPKRQRTSTYEISNKNDKQNPSSDVSPVGRSQQTEDNSKQLNLLVQEVSSRRQTRNIAVDSPATALPSPVPSGNQHDLPSKKEHLAHQNSKSASKLNLLRDEELPRVTPTTEPLSEIAKKSRPKVPKAQSIVRLRNLDMTATPSSTQKFHPGVKLNVNTPKSSVKVTQSSKIVKPVFTVGRNDASPAKKEGFKRDGSGIPRFVSYARRLKVPNFAKIHERAFNRMEALDDYVDKKRNRTDTIGSAKKRNQTDTIGSATKKPQHKVPPEEVFQPTITSTKNLKINFISTRSSSNRTPDFSKSKLEEPKSGKSLRFVASAQKLRKKASKIAETPQSSVKEAPKSSSEFCNAVKQTLKTFKNSSNIDRRSSQPTEETPKQKSFIKGSVKKVATSRKSPKTPPGKASAKKVSPSGQPRHLKENVKPVNPSIRPPSKQIASQKLEISGSLQKRPEIDSKTDSNLPSSYVPYRGAVKQLTNQNALKKMAQRKPNIKSSQEIREGQKKILKGVRFNRRFELQMANRGITI